MNKQFAVSGNGLKSPILIESHIEIQDYNFIYRALVLNFKLEEFKNISIVFNYGSYENFEKIAMVLVKNPSPMDYVKYANYVLVVSNINGEIIKVIKSRIGTEFKLITIEKYLLLNETNRMIVLDVNYVKDHLDEILALGYKLSEVRKMVTGGEDKLIQIATRANCDDNWFDD